MGRWRVASLDERVEYCIAATANGLTVTGRDVLDLERIEITEVKFDGRSLIFKSRMPSTNHRLEHHFTALPNGRVLQRSYFEEEWIRVEP